MIKGCLKDVSAYSSREDRSVATRYTKIYSDISMITEMQARSTVRRHLVDFKMAVIKQTEPELTKGQEGCGEMASFRQLLVQMHNGATIVENTMVSKPRITL